MPEDNKISLNCDLLTILDIFYILLKQKYISKSLVYLMVLCTKLNFINFNIFMRINIQINSEKKNYLKITVIILRLY